MIQQALRIIFRKLEEMYGIMYKDGDIGEFIKKQLEEIYNKRYIKGYADGFEQATKDFEKLKK